MLFRSLYKLALSAKKDVEKRNRQKGTDTSGKGYASMISRVQSYTPTLNRSKKVTQTPSSCIGSSGYDSLHETSATSTAPTTSVEPDPKMTPVLPHSSVLDEDASLNFVPRNEQSVEYLLRLIMQESLSYPADFYIEFIEKYFDGKMVNKNPTKGLKSLLYELRNNQREYTNFLRAYSKHETEYLTSTEYNFSTMVDETDTFYRSEEHHV